MPHMTHRFVLTSFVVNKIFIIIIIGKRLPTFDLSEVAAVIFTLQGRRI